MVDQAQQQAEDDVFDQAFKELSKDDPIGTQAAPAATGAAGAAGEAEGAPGATGAAADEGGLPEPAEVAAAAAAAAGAPGATGAAAPAGEGAPGATGAAAPRPEPEGAVRMSDEQLLERFRDIVKPAATEPEKKVETPVIAPYTAEEQRLVETYQKDWPDVYAAEQAIRAREYQALTAHIFDQFRPVLQHLMQTTGQVVAQTHEQQLYSRVTDYADVAPKVVDWVKTQPDFLKPSFEAVMKNGSVDQVVDLINLYRTSTGTKAPEPAPKPQPPTAQAAPPAAQQQAKDPAVARAAKGLAPVASKRTGVQQDAIAGDDFDGAFAAFSKEP